MQFYSFSSEALNLFIYNLTTNMKSAVYFICLAALLVNTVSGGVLNSDKTTQACLPLVTCRLMCKFGYVYEGGCPICKCNPPPTCPKGMTPDALSRSCDRFRPLFGLLKKNECGPGAICWTIGSTNDRGVCCEQSFQCPVNDVITTCQITDANCLDDSHCGSGFKCCSYGCGKVCINSSGETGTSSWLTALS